MIKNKTSYVLGFFFLSMLSIVSAKSKQPNIVFIFSDDHAVQSIGAYGSKINKTPNIDRLAKEGAIFENSFCNNSICGPSRASILTGKFSHKNGFYMNVGGKKFNGAQVTFPKTLQKNGYQTALIGKWHLKSNPTGFDHWEILPGQGSYYNPDFYTKDSKRRYKGYVTTVTTDLSIDWLNKREKDKPFLLMCQQKAPHRTWAPSLKYARKYESQNIAEPTTLFDKWDKRSKTLSKNAMSIDKHFYYAYDLKVQQEVPFASQRERWMKDSEYRRMSPEQRKAWDAIYKERNDKFLKNPPKGKDLVRWKYQRYIKNYLRCVDSVDDSVGRILGYLEENGLAENTIVVYSSDQGFYLGEHGWYDKRWMFEESMRMPFLIRWPGKIKPGSRNKQLIQNIDYAPTFLEAAGVTVPKEIQGKSLLPLFTNVKEKQWRKNLYYHYYEHMTEHQVPRHEGVRGERYKLIHFYTDKEYNLFDLKTDPTEMTDLAKDPKYAQVLAKMKMKLAKARKLYDLPNLTESAKQK